MYVVIGALSLKGDCQATFIWKSILSMVYMLANHTVEIYGIYRAFNYNNMNLLPFLYIPRHSAAERGLRADGVQMQPNPVYDIHSSNEQHDYDDIQ